MVLEPVESRNFKRQEWDLAIGDSVGLCKSSSLFEVLDDYFLASFIWTSWSFENQQLALLHGALVQVTLDVYLWQILAVLYELGICSRPDPLPVRVGHTRLGTHCLCMCPINPGNLDSITNTTECKLFQLWLFATLTGVCHLRHLYETKNNHLVPQKGYSTYTDLPNHQ